ncbi:MAG: hypothetical protein JSV91_03305, partial [Phycisphaerales bacterium]
PDLFGAIIIQDSYTGAWSPFDYFEAVGTYAHLNRHSPMIVMLLLPRDSESVLTAAQLRLGSLVEMLSGEVVPSDGDPWIRCDLSERQLESVRTGGLPPSLIEAMINEAERAKWRQAYPGEASSKQMITVNADEHFRGGDG